jgi:hypothetical protein
MNARPALRAVRAPALACLIVFAAGAAGAQGAGAGPSATSEVVMRAMRDELSRSIQQLHLDTLPKPYFIAYRVTENRTRNANGRLGSLVGTNEGRGGRQVQVEVRVGDYAFDNTNYFGAGFMPQAFVGFGSLPLDDDYQELRRQLWLSTDVAYKQALEALSQKRAALAGRSRTDSVADFSREPATNTTDEVPVPAPTDRAKLEALARELSATFRQSPEIYNSTVGVSESWSREIYLNSEGTSFTRARNHASVGASASTQALDGTGMSMGYNAQALTFAELPGRDSLLKGVRDLASRLTQQRHVPLADAYDGPVLFEGAAAAELFNSMIATKLVGTRRPVTSPTFAALAANGGGGNDWEDLIGSLVLPRSFTVVDDPTIRELDGHIVDHHRVDDDGVTTHATTVIDHGVLKTLLTDRTPVTGVDQSTGNRFGFGPRPLNVIVTADSTLSDADMRTKLLTLASAQGHAYGVIVRQLSGGNAPAAGDDPQEFIAAMMGQQRGANGPVARGMRVVKVYADGHEESMRGAEIFGLTAGSFKEIAAASRTRIVQEVQFTEGGNPLTGTAGSGPVTYQIPALLFANVTIRKLRGTTPSLPVVPPPR